MYPKHKKPVSISWWRRNSFLFARIVTSPTRTGQTLNRPSAQETKSVIHWELFCKCVDLLCQAKTERDHEQDVEWRQQDKRSNQLRLTLDCVLMGPFKLVFQNRACLSYYSLMRLFVDYVEMISLFLYIVNFLLKGLLKISPITQFCIYSQRQMFSNYKMKVWISKGWAMPENGGT